MKVYQLGKAGVDVNMVSNDKMNILKSYAFYGTFPTSISAIDLSYDQADTIEEFTVDLQVQWWDAIDTSGNSLLGSGTEDRFDAGSVTSDY
jgi:hypothetical protein